MTKVDELRDRIPPQAQDRLDTAVQTFRQNHKDPSNIALHAAGYWSIAKGAIRILRRKRFRGLLFVAFGVALLLIGHEIEGTEPFASLKSVSKSA